MAQDFRKSSPLLFETMGFEQNIMLISACGRGGSHLMVDKKERRESKNEQESKSESETKNERESSAKDTVHEGPVTYFPQLGSTF